MDQGIVSTTAGHYVRLALILFASVLGLLILGFVFGSSSASADDGGPDDSGLVPAVAELAGGVVENVAPATAPVTAAIPLADVPLSPAVLSPVVTTLETVTATLDSTVGSLLGTVDPLIHLLPAVSAVSVDPPAATVSLAPAAALVIEGMANGAWLQTGGPLGTGAIASGAVAPLTALPAAALGAGFLVLLFSRRLGLVSSTMPSSPVFETDTSPD